MVDVGPVNSVGRLPRGWRRAVLACVACLLVAPWQAALADSPAAAPIPLELNKLEPLPASAAAAGTPSSSPGCRFYMVVSNPDAEPIAQLRLDLMLFGPDGVIARRVALDLAPLAAHKTAVRLFDIAGLPCDGIARVLVNDVLACETGKHEAATSDAATQACLNRLQVSARGKVELTK